MDMDIALHIKRFAIAAIPALLGIIMHEVAHGWAAEKCGDPTARFMGRITLNPIPHIDPMGLLVFVLTSVSGSMVFGWAKPVPVDPRNFRDPRKDYMLVSLAGPLTNMLLAVVFAFALRVLIGFVTQENLAEGGVWLFMIMACKTGVVINFGLAWLNLLPIPPLDGSKVLAYFLPRDMAWKFEDAGRYGFVILLLLLFTGILGHILGPLVITSANLTLALTGL